MTHPRDAKSCFVRRAPCRRSAGRCSDTTAPAVEWRTPTSILIAALDDLPDGDADVLVVLACVLLRGLTPAPVEQDGDGLYACFGLDRNALVQLLEPPCTDVVWEGRSRKAPPYPDVCWACSVAWR